MFTLALEFSLIRDSVITIFINFRERSDLGSILGTIS